ncbi:hypothetical protein [Actinocorallia longicatena]|uniref:Ig-like domain-containing protein n=1 Tax=Actinocorallia longicatena TaxID=111803 RepID=A0ABP6Q8R5_9ACTN
MHKRLISGAVAATVAGGLLLQGSPSFAAQAVSAVPAVAAAAPAKLVAVSVSPQRTTAGHKIKLAATARVPRGEAAAVFAEIKRPTDVLKIRLKSRGHGRYTGSWTARGDFAGKITFRLVGKFADSTISRKIDVKGRPSVYDGKATPPEVLPNAKTTLSAKVVGRGVTSVTAVVGAPGDQTNIALRPSERHSGYAVWSGQFTAPGTDKQLKLPITYVARNSRGTARLTTDGLTVTPQAPPAPVVEKVSAPATSVVYKGGNKFTVTAQASNASAGVKISYWGAGTPYQNIDMKLVTPDVYTATVVVPGTAKGKIDFNVKAYGTAEVKSGGSVVVKKATWLTKFNASPEPVKKGKSIKISGVLIGLNSAGTAYSGLKGGTIQILFRPTGSKTYTTVKTVTSGSSGKISTTVTAAAGGTWYTKFVGTAYWNPSASGGDWVKVTG